MTNQASEDEVSLIPFEVVVLAHMELAYESSDEARRATESVVGMAKALIRTEKLKLLAEVRERVVGEEESYLDEPSPAFEGAYEVANAMIEAQNNLRSKQITELTKLEAEL